MKHIVIVLVLMSLVSQVSALEITQNMKTRIGIFDACEQSLTYGFYDKKNYDIRTTLKTTGAFGVMYPFEAKYRSYGTYHLNKFKPQDYFYETQTLFSRRTKEITYKDGIPQERISTKDDDKKSMKIMIDDKYEQSIDLLSVFGVLIEQVIRTGNCDFQSYSFNGKKYSLSKVQKVGDEDIITEFYSGKADKCSYSLEVLDDAEAGFLLSKDIPVYFWIMKDQLSGAPFVAKILVEETPFGELESVTTNIEVKE